MTNTEKIKKFIKDNELDFSGEGSGLNSNCCILAGYCLYLGIDEGKMGDIAEELDILPDSHDVSPWGEFIRVFKYAESSNYGAYWETEEAKATYVF